MAGWSLLAIKMQRTNRCEDGGEESALSSDPDPNRMLEREKKKQERQQKTESGRMRLWNIIHLTPAAAVGGGRQEKFPVFSLCLVWCVVCVMCQKTIGVYQPT